MCRDLGGGAAEELKCESSFPMRRKKRDEGHPQLGLREAGRARINQ
jgi:hypothetical protein